jgi:hypothetical protein
MGGVEPRPLASMLLRCASPTCTTLHSPTATAQARSSSASADSLVHGEPRQPSIDLSPSVPLSLPTSTCVVGSNGAKILAGDCCEARVYITQTLRRSNHEVHPDNEYYYLVRRHPFQEQNYAIAAKRSRSEALHVYADRIIYMDFG